MPSYGGKRKRTYAPRNSRFKRRRFGRMARRGRRSGRSTTAYTSEAAKANSFGFRSRRVRPRAYRKMLWRDSAMKSHYRSVLALSDPFTTVAGTISSQVFYYPTMEFGARFWTPAGGAIPIDTAVTVPNFQDDIILRGGMLSMNVCNTGVGGIESGDINVTVYLIISDELPSIGALIPPDGSTGSTATFSRDWDITCVPDSKRVFAKRTLLMRNALLKPLDSVKVMHRLRVQKIDQQDYLNDNNKMYWVVKVSSNHGNTDGYRVTASYNLSFSGDAVL